MAAEDKRSQIKAVIATAIENGLQEWSLLVTAVGSAWDKVAETYTEQVWETSNVAGGIR